MPLKHFINDNGYSGAHASILRAAHVTWNYAIAIPWANKNSKCVARGTFSASAENRNLAALLGNFLVQQNRILIVNATVINTHNSLWFYE